MTRFDMLGVIRTYAADKLEQTGDAPAVLRAHARYFASILPSRTDQVSAWQVSARERENLLAAFSFCRHHAVELAQVLAVALDAVLVTQGPAALHRTVLEQALALQTDKGVTAAHCDLLRALGRHHGLRGAHALAAQHFERGLAGAQSLGDSLRSGWLASHLCFSLRPLGRFDEARLHGEASLSAARSNADPVLEANAEQSLGLVDLACSDLPSAVARFRAAAAIARTCGAPR